MWTSQVYGHHDKMAHTKTHRTSQNTEYTKTQQTLRNNYFLCFSVNVKVKIILCFPYITKPNAVQVQNENVLS